LYAACLAICRVSGLALGEIDVDLPPAQLPLDSLQTVDAVTALAQFLGRTVSLQAWGEALSLRALVDGNAGVETPWLAALESPLPHFVRRRRRRGAILVTGGTGLIGQALVNELRRRGQRVIFMARGAGEIGGIAADVGRPRFGLDEPCYRALVTDVDVVVHLAGAVNWVLPYSSLAATNVDGTEHVLALCADAGARLVHVSSQIVCHGIQDSPALVVDDDEDPAWLHSRISA